MLKANIKSVRIAVPKTCGTGTGTARTLFKQKKVEDKHMEYKRLILIMMTQVEEDDVIFLQQVYTFMKIHLENKGICIQFPEAEK